MHFKMIKLLSVTWSPWLTKSAIFAIAYFTPIKEIVHVMLIFLLVDFISGFWAAKKEKQKTESVKLRRSVYKFIWYTVAMMMAWMMENTFKLGWTNLANITAGFICFVELKSIFENITRITGERVFIKIYKLFEKKAETFKDIQGYQPNDKLDTSNPPKGNIPSEPKKENP